MKTEQLYFGIPLFLSTFSLAQVGINTDNPQATLDVNGKTIIRNIPELSAKTDATKVLILNNESAAGTNTPEIQQIDPIYLNIQTGKTVYAAAKDGNWSLLNLNLGNSWYPINLKSSDTKIGNPLLFNNGVYTVPEDGIYMVHMELQFEAGVNLELLGGKSIGFLVNDQVVEQKYVDGIRVSLLGITLASIPVTSTSLDAMLNLNEGDELTFAINSGGILPVDLGLLQDGKINLSVYKISNPI